MDRFQAMATFQRVAELGSFSKAAESLNLPRATVTNAVQRLEQHLGVRLFHRTTRKVTLTHDGTLYLERCTRLLAELEDTEALFAGAARQPRGLVRIDLPERLARLTIIPVLPDFCAQFPDVRLQLGSTDRLVDLVGEAVDCAVRVGPLRDSSLVARRVGVMEQVNVGARSYLDQHGRPQTLADLAGHYAVNYFSTRTGRDLDWEYHEGGRDHYLRLRSRISVSSSEAYLACCQAGLGLIQAPRSGIEPLLAQGELEEVLPRWKPAPLPVAIVYPHQRQLSSRVRVFVEWVAALLAGELRPK